MAVEGLNLDWVSFPYRFHDGTDQRQAPLLGRDIVNTFYMTNTSSDVLFSFRDLIYQSPAVVGRRHRLNSPRLPMPGFHITHSLLTVAGFKDCVCP